MKVKIQNFTLSLFLLMSLLGILMWSVSLFWVNQQQNEKTAQLYRENWQLQIDQLQTRQRLWLQYRFYELSDWIGRQSDTLETYRIINRYYEQYAQIRLIQLNDVQAGQVLPDEIQQACRQRIDAAINTSMDASVPAMFDCRQQQQPLMGIAGRITQQGKSMELVLLMSYFHFINDFKQLTAKQIVLEYDEQGRANYHEVWSQDSDQQTLYFDFDGYGSLSVLLPRESFPSLWLRQSVWVVPGILIAALVFYALFYLSLLSPLFRIQRKLEKVVLAHHPGHGSQRQSLAPGLWLLQKYFLHLTHLAKNDPLTGLSNRVIFEERLQQAVLEGKRSGRKYALVFIDIKQFHRINQDMGAYFGDMLLKQLAKRLTDALRESDSLARLEKDNFALLLEFSDDDQISGLVEKIYQTLTEDYFIYGRKLKVNVCMGIAIYPDHAQEADTLALKADEALLKAKKGDWPVVFEKPSSDKADYSGFTVIQSLRQALDNQEFKLVYQPVMDLSAHNTSYFEALLRWENPQKHRHSIERTIELAEKNHLIKPLTQWIIESACQQLKALNGCGTKIAINLSMIDLHDQDLPDRIGEALQRYGIDAGNLMIEITEGQIMQDPDKVIEILSRLNDMGLSLSIDDFGTGQASLTYLKKLPVEKLKIDQSFIRDMISDDDDRAIVSATIKLAHTLGIKVVAEGVESVEIHDLLIELGCDFVQGYFISRPLEQDQVAAWCEPESARNVS